jgi:3-hydroxyisobutyrate dehydrogenase-like beta-hydroxyacid dehydrogenase
MSRIGMVGVGLMGHGIATNLLKHGHQLTVLEHSGNQPLDALKKSGAQSSPELKKVVAEAEFLLLCVTGSAQVEAVLLGEQGALKHLPKGACVIDCSTAIPSSTDRVAKAVQSAGYRFIDAPMTRTPKEAAEGRLNLLVGGEDKDFQNCLPVLKSFAENIVHVGPAGAGHRMKLIHNYVSLGSVALIAEAAACAQISGIQAEVLVEVLAKGGGGGIALERLKPYLLQSDPNSLKFSIANAFKDLGYYNTMALEAGADRPIAAAVANSLELATQQTDPQTFLPELVKLLVLRQKSLQDPGSTP